MSSPKGVADVDPPTPISPVRLQPLAELSELLGVELLDVQRDQLSPNAPATWWLLFAAEPDRLFAFPSGFFRNVRELNTSRRWWSRNPDLRPLTKAESRRALRLMHEHVESTTDTITTEGKYQR